MFKSGDLSIVALHPHIFVSAAVLGVACNFATMAVISATSSITLKVLNTFRAVGVVIFSVVFLGEVVTFMEACGYGLALTGFFGYNVAASMPPIAAAFDKQLDELCAR